MHNTHPNGLLDPEEMTEIEVDTDVEYELSSASGRTTEMYF